MPTIPSETELADITEHTTTLAATSGSNTHVVRVSDDTYTSSENPSSNYNGTPWLVACRDAGGITARTWMKFNLSHIPQNAHFTRATVNLFLAEEGDPSDELLGLYYSDNDTWKEHTLTHNNAPTYDPVPVDVIDSPSTPNMFIPTTWYEWEVTSDVQQAIEGDGVLSFVLTRVDESSTDTSTKNFITREHSIILEVPTIPNIAIEYEIPTTSGLEVDGYSTSPRIDYIRDAKIDQFHHLNGGLNSLIYNCMKLLGRYEDIIPYLEKTLQYLNNDQNPDLWSQLGLLYLVNESNLEKAVEVWKRAIALDSSIVEKYSGLNVVYTFDAMKERGEQIKWNVVNADIETGEFSVTIGTE